jgi:probable F420-dependent oxidoreductase
MELGRVGVWHRDVELTPDLASGLERLGYGAVWIGGSPAGDLAVPETLLDSTRDIVVATGIVNIWQDGAGVVAESYHRIEARHPGRFLLGIGAGHREAAREYTRPYEALVQYLDALDTAGVPPGRRVLAALGPRVLRLARDRTAGAHPYFTTPDHTREARAVLGPDALLAPEQKVVLEPDPHAARAVARPVLGIYLGLANYVANFRRMGFTDEDFAGGGSDRLVDALIAHGDPDTVARRVTEHLDAGADHVAIQAYADDAGAALAQLERLAPVLLEL